MDSDKVENIEQVKTFEGTRADNEETKVNSHVDTEECEERSERRNRNRTEKGLQFDLEIGTKRKERAAKDVSQSENVGSRVDIRADDNKPPDQYRITNSFFIPILLALGRPYIEAVN